MPSTPSGSPSPSGGSPTPAVSTPTPTSTPTGKKKTPAASPSPAASPTPAAAAKATPKKPSIYDVHKALFTNEIGEKLSEENGTITVDIKMNFSNSQMYIIKLGVPAPVWGIKLTEDSIKEIINQGFQVVKSNDTDENPGWIKDDGSVSFDAK